MPRLLRRILLLVVLTGLPVSSLQAEDWPTYMHDNTRRGSTTEELTFPLQLNWEIKSPATPHTAWEGQKGRIHEGKEMGDRVRFDDAFHVTTKEGRVYYGSTVDHQVHCVDQKTGEELWTFFTDGPVRLAPTLWNNFALFGSDDGYVYCVDATDGSQQWKFRAGPEDYWLLGRGDMVSRWPVRTSITVSEDGTAYFGAGLFPYENVFLYALKAESGEVIWKRNNISQFSANRSDIAPQGYLLVENDVLVVPSGRSLPAVFNRQSGDFMHKRTFGWRGDAGGVIGGTRAFLADGQIYAAGPHHMLAMDQETGDIGFGYFQGKQVAVSEDLVFTLHDGKITCYTRIPYAEASLERHALQQEINGLQRKLWKAKGEEADNLRKEMAAIEQKIADSMPTGQLWEAGCALEGSLAICGNAVVAGGEQRVQIFDRKTGDQLEQHEVEGEATGFAIANGSLFVSTTTGNIYNFSPEKTSGDKQGSTAKLTFSDQDENVELIQQAADKILKATDSDIGFCLIVGAERGRLAYELAQRSNLKIYGIEPDPAKVREAREKLKASNLYGHRVVIHQADLADIPYANYFANLVVSETEILTGELPADPELIVRHVKPLGGQVCLQATSADSTRWLEQMGLKKDADIKEQNEQVVLTRSALPGAANWSHQYGNAGNTASTEDRRVKGGLSVLWYGDPGAKEMVNRHDAAVGPLSVNGRLIVQGQDTVMAHDAYNGVKLWERENPRSIRTGVFRNENPGNLVASDSSIFIMEREVCWELDAATGEVIREHRVPVDENQEDYEWGYVAYSEGKLFGTATIRKEIEERSRRRGKATVDNTDSIFAIDVETGDLLWKYQGHNITHHTIAHGPDHVYFIDSHLTAEQRAELLREDKSKYKDLSPEELEQAEKEIKEIDARLAVAIEANSGDVAWEVAVDVTDCSDIGTGGGKLTLMFQNNMLILCGANANGHYWKQFMEGEFSKRRLVALSSIDGEKVWAKDANYRHRPIIVEDQLIAEPWSYDLYSGEQKMREDPITGEAVPWSLMRSGHHCGMITGCPDMLMFRSGFTSFFDLKEDGGTQHFAGHRIGCWINAIPANGLVMVPESSAGCVCLFSLASTITLEPREDAPRSPWTIYSLVGEHLPVKQMHLNLGAPGDRQDATGTVWLGYPRPRPSRETSLDYELDLSDKFAESGKYEDFNPEFLEIKADEPKWLYASYGTGLTSCTLPLLREEDAPRTYSVKLHFATPSITDTAEKVVFDVKVNGEVSLANAELEPSSQSELVTGTVIEIPNVMITRDLQLELVPQSAEQAKSLRLSAIEVIVQEKTAINE
ncbi:outer membrane biogenesis protein BamB [Polystyrenella longa]|uniref:Outer membrane biogenesis protein BamB n=1 Tax=Polystyrenella longa TaxID=2528007 RepID=A0A518CQE3_9PLAN|nr:PQQ-binding-like beta-propeller repeat protein [Polystyrenella longa]QDU81448.1 outer membrane biogenesis protein BamB [Polystyrenella longa]